MEQNKPLVSTPELKPFKRPRLQVYGELKDLTKAAGNHGNTDNVGSPPNTKTHS